jgi:hypothetical protein
MPWLRAAFAVLLGLRTSLRSVARRVARWGLVRIARVAPESLGQLRDLLGHLRQLLGQLLLRPPTRRAVKEVTIMRS